MKIKIIAIILVISIFSVVFPFQKTYASSIGDIITSADGFLGNGAAVGSVIDENQLKSTSNFLYKVLLSIGIVVMFIVGTIIGIQFMVASVEEKAKVKEALVPYIVGCAVILGAFGIWSMVVNIGQDMVPTSYTKTTTTPTTPIVDENDLKSYEKGQELGVKWYKNNITGKFYDNARCRELIQKEIDNAKKTNSIPGLGSTDTLNENIIRGYINKLESYLKEHKDTGTTEEQIDQEKYNAGQQAALTWASENIIGRPYSADVITSTVSKEINRIKTTKTIPVGSTGYINVDDDFVKGYVDKLMSYIN